MNNLYLQTVTLSGLHYKRNGKGGGYVAPLPFTPEDGAFAPTWDPDTFTLTYFVPQPDIGDEPQDPAEMEVVITEEEIEAGIVYVTTPKPPKVPQSVTPAQFRKAVNELGLRDGIETAVAAADQDAQDHWEYATSVDRDNTLVVSIGQVLGLSEADIDNVFILAASKG